MAINLQQSPGLHRTRTVRPDLNVEVPPNDPDLFYYHTPSTVDRKEEDQLAQDLEVQKVKHGKKKHKSPKSKKRSSSSGKKRGKKSSKRRSSGKDASEDGPTSTGEQRTNDEIETAAPLRSDGASTGVSATTGTTGGTSGQSSTNNESTGGTGTTSGESTGDTTGKTTGEIGESGTTGQSGVTTHTSASAKTKGGQTATLTTSVSASEGEPKRRGILGLLSCKPKKKSSKYVTQYE
ncbi:hypothetical protein TELCIR_12243 [Teladorsagia circumcincta]|uniref:Uncharacterized protein n=1 Tax=Teladorsagia circumcincta TaxID=45464 RepID=A0A2G9U784_TELCI|nr:hypothetical protein TELCIR_12243 [Teladorsagia circumcincta]